MTARTRVRHKPRRLKIGYHHYERYCDGRWSGSQAIPSVRLCGLWLERAGFAIGRRIHVEVAAGRIVLMPEPSTPTP